MTVSRTATAVLTTAVVGLALVACSGEDGQGSSASAAHTTACRTYELKAAGADAQARQLLLRAARSGSWENEPVNQALTTVRTAVEEAGLVHGLSDDDFALYSDLAGAVGEAYSRANPTGGTGITPATAARLGSAVDAVRGACTSA